MFSSTRQWFSGSGSSTPGCPPPQIQRSPTPDASMPRTPSRRAPRKCTPQGCGSRGRETGRRYVARCRAAAAAIRWRLRHMIPTQSMVHLIQVRQGVNDWCHASTESTHQVLKTVFVPFHTRWKTAPSSRCVGERRPLVSHPALHRVIKPRGTVAAALGEVGQGPFSWRCSKVQNSWRTAMVSLDPFLRIVSV